MGSCHKSLHKILKYLNKNTLTVSCNDKNWGSLQLLFSNSCGGDSVHMESTKIRKIKEYLSEWELMLQKKNHLGRIFVNCSLNFVNEDLVVKCVITPRFALIGPDKTPTTYLFNIKDYENMSMSNCLHMIRKSFGDFLPIWISLAHEVKRS